LPTRPATRRPGWYAVSTAAPSKSTSITRSPAGHSVSAPGSLPLPANPLHPNPKLQGNPSRHEMNTAQGFSITLANPRGFCAGVDRAIDIVNKALDMYGAPIFVRHEVVHNKFVVENLRQRGAVFVDELCDVPKPGPGQPMPIVVF